MVSHPTIDEDMNGSLGRRHSLHLNVACSRLALTVGGWFVASRLALVIAGMMATTRFLAYPPARPWPTPPAPAPFSLFSRWDSQWYFGIASHGYALPHRHFAPYVYFPLVPGLLHVMPSHVRLVGAVLLISLISLAGLVLVALQGEAISKGNAGLYAAATMIAYPLSFLLSAPYTEGPFLLLSAGCLMAARAGRYGLAAALGALCALTRNLGVLIALPIFLTWASEVGASRNRRTHAVWAVLAPGIALGLFAMYLAHVAGSPVAFLTHESAWGRAAAWPWSGIVRAIHGVLAPHAGRPPLLGHPAYRYSPWDRGMYDAWDLGALCFGVAGLAYGVRAHMPRELTLWGALLLFAPLVAPTMHGAYALASMSRYVLSDFPVFLGVGSALARHPRVLPAVLIPLSLLGGIAMSFYVTWNWIA